MLFWLRRCALWFGGTRGVTDLNAAIAGRGPGSWPIGPPPDLVRCHYPESQSHPAIVCVCRLRSAEFGASVFCSCIQCVICTLAQPTLDVNSHTASRSRLTHMVRLSLHLLSKIIKCNQTQSKVHSPVMCNQTHCDMSLACREDTRPTQRVIAAISLDCAVPRSPCSPSNLLFRCVSCPSVPLPLCTLPLPRCYPLGP